MANNDAKQFAEVNAISINAGNMELGGGQSSTDETSNSLEGSIGDISVGISGNESSSSDRPPLGEDPHSVGDGPENMDDPNYIFPQNRIRMLYSEDDLEFPNPFS